MAHEVGHIVRDHPGRARRMGLVSMQELDQWNIGGDLSMNPDLIDAGFVLPGGKHTGVFPATFGFPRGLLTEEYYRMLQEKADKEKKEGGGSGGSGGESGDDQGEEEGGGGGSGGGGKGPCHGKCGSCGGNPLPGEPEKGSEASRAGRSPSDIENVRRQVAEAVRQAASKSQGNVPQGWKAWAEAHLEPPKIPWQQQLARAARKAAQWKAGKVDYRWDGYSRRQAAIGYGPGKPIMPRLRSPVPKVMLAGDTSGSMGSDELQHIINESDGILKAVGSNITFVACDCQIHEVKKVRSAKEIADLLTGRGGTSFVPVFDHIAKLNDVDKPDVLVFVTDGMGDAPANPPPYEVIWVLVGSYKTAPCDWGKQIEVD